MPSTFQAINDIVVRVLLGLALLTGAICLVDWAIRMRRISPFSPVARFFRRWIDPMMKPLETVIVRRGGQPQSAPFFAFMTVIIGGILIIQLMAVLFGLAMQVRVGVTSPTRFVQLLLSWALKFVTFALIVRVISTWLPVSPYSKWIRWSYVATEWLLAPLRRFIPPFGSIDITPIAAYFLLIVAGRILGLR
jgi:YggT family protein